MTGATALHEFSFGPTGSAGFAPTFASATAVAGVDTTTLAPPVRIENTYHDHRSEALPLPLHQQVVGGYMAINPSVESFQPATPATLDYAATGLIVVVLVVGFTVLLIRLKYFLRPIFADALKAQQSVAADV